MTFNVIIATSGRETLSRMISSIEHQLTADDFITFIWDAGHPSQFTINTKATVIHIINSSPQGYWGHGSRNKWQEYLPGKYHLNGDDDDIYLPDAMDKVRKYCVDDYLYIFKMQVNETLIPKNEVLEYSNVGTPCGVYRPHDLPTWLHIYGGDFHFYRRLAETRPVVFVDEVIYKVMK